METIAKVPRKRRSKQLCEATEPEDGRKKFKVESPVQEPQGQYDITQGGYHQGLPSKWRRLSQTTIGALGTKEVAALGQELEVVASSEEQSSVIHSDGINAATTTAAEFSSLQAQVEELHSRKGAMSPEKSVRDLEDQIEKQSKMIEFYETRVEDLKAKNSELEDSLAAASSKSPRIDSRGKEVRDENSLEDTLLQNSRLKAELNRVLSQLDVAGFQTDLMTEKKDEAIEELTALQNQKAVYDATKAELISLQRQRHLFEAEKTELAELRRQRHLFEAEKSELAELRSLKTAFEALEAERDELAILRLEKETFEEAKSELKAVYGRLLHQEALLKAVAEELQTLRTQKKTFQAGSEELCQLRGLQAKYEAVSAEISMLQQQRASFADTATEELVALRKQNAVFETVAEELEELRKQKGMSDADRDELESLRKQRARVGPADGEFSSFHSEVKPKTTKVKVERGGQKQARLVNTIKYLEGKIAEDKEGHSRCGLELEAAMTKVHQTCVSLHVVEQQLVSVKKEKEVLYEEKTYVLGEKEALQGEKNRLMRKKKRLFRKWRNANEQNLGLQHEIENMEKAKTRVEIDSIELNRELFLKAAKIECLKAELKLRQEKDEADVADAERICEEIETLRELNRAYIDQEVQVREELNTVTKQLEDAVSADLCRICVRNTRDTVLLPCTHLQSCVGCVRELIKYDKPCPTCARSISGFVQCESVA